ncbi:MAG: TlpA family protein disulfide reductase [Gammaproteobacteria bacterium]|nr:TlpA family protein disulfide reductase [Gammaproteobacteria bacterium]
MLLGLVLNTGARAEPVDFSLPDVQGKQRSLSEFRGKWVVVNYWATWCPPCLEEIPDLVLFHERHHAKDAMVLGINFEDIPAEQLRAFVDENQMSYPVLRNGDIDPPHARLDVEGLPMTYIISPEGEPVARHVGSITADELEAFIEKKTRAQAANKQTRAALPEPQP